MKDQIHRARRGHDFAPRAGVPALYAQDGKGKDAVVYEHYFVGSADWYATEYSPETGEAFGWVEILPGCGELGYFSLPELERTLVRGVFPIERELGWTPRTLRSVLEARG